MNSWIFCMLCQVQDDQWDLILHAEQQENGVLNKVVCAGLKKCCWCFTMVSLVLLKLHCVSKITPSHLCLQSIPHLDKKHYIPPDCQPLLMPQIASASYRMAALCYNAPLAPFHFLQVIQCIASLSFRDAVFLLTVLSGNISSDADNKIGKMNVNFEK